MGLGELAPQGKRALKAQGVELTVFMPVYNAAGHLAAAVESVLTQSYDDFELLVIDDGSTDASASLLRRYARQDRRIRIVKHARNRGLAFSFAHGYQESRGRYIARMDADDICEPKRLERQWHYLKRHRGVAVLGTWLRSFGAKEGILRLPCLHEDILSEAVFQNPLAHPSIMLDRQRAPALPDFRAAYQPADDYDLWSRWLKRGVHMAALPEPLLRYRLHPGQASRTEAMERGAWKVRQDWLRTLALRPTRAEAALHQRLCVGQGERVERQAIDAWAQKLEGAGLNHGLPRAPWLRRLALIRAQGSGAGRLRRALDPRTWAWEARRFAVKWQA